MHLHNILQTIHSAPLQFFLPEQVNLTGQWEVAISELSYLSMYQNVNEENITSFDTKFSNFSEYSHLEPGFCHWFFEIMEAMNTLIQERHTHAEASIAVKMFRGTQKIEIRLANKGSGLAFLVRMWVIIFEAMLTMTSEYCWAEETSQASFCLWHCPLTFSHDKHSFDWVPHCWPQKRSLAALLSLFQAKI